MGGKEFHARGNGQKLRKAVLQTFEKMKGNGNEKILIPDIARKIKSKLKSLKLTPGIWPKEFLDAHGLDKHRYFSPCITKNRQVVGFYARLHDNRDTKEKFIREINFLKRIERLNTKVNKLIPDILNFKIEKDFEWFVREYPKAPPLGGTTKLTQATFPLIHKKITDSIMAISRIASKQFSRLKKFNYKHYITPGEYEGLIKKKLITEKTASKLLTNAKENISLLKKENKYMCHGDLNLGNILSDKKDLWIIDWELAHINNFAYDIAYLWTHLWGAQSAFRKKLLQIYIKKLNKNQLATFKKLFPVVVSYMAVSGAVHKIAGEKKTQYKKRKTFYTKVLKNCLDFKQLTKT